MIVLYKYIPAWDLPDLSPFCVKVETYLRMTKTPFRTALGDPRKAPKGKLPYIEHEGRTIADSDQIISYFEERAEIPLDAGLTAREAALCQAVRSMLEEHLYFVVLYERWQLDSGWKLYTPILKDFARQAGIPGFLQPILLPQIRKKVVNSLHGQGTGRRTTAQVASAGKRIVDSLAELLGDGPYFCGDRVRSIDATVYAFVASLLIAPFESETRSHARGKPNLQIYRERVFRDFYA